MITLLGIDQSQKGDAGFAVVSLGEGQPVILHTFLEEYKKVDGYHNIPKTDTRWRCRRFYNVVRKLIIEYKPDICVTEIVRAFQGGKPDPFTIMRLSEIQGAMNLAVPKDIPLYRWNTSSWQAVILHPKQKDDRKVLSVALAKKLYGLDVSEHEADAIHMCVAYPFLKDRRGSIAVLV
jgi:hypothetical protein